MNVRLSNPVINNFSGLEMELSLACSIFTIKEKVYLLCEKKLVSRRTCVFVAKDLKALCNNYLAYTLRFI